MSHDIEFVYVGDPMCSWCWGFAPVLEALSERFAIPLRVRVGGLRPGPSAEPMDEKMSAFLDRCWQQVHAASGQPFDHDALGAMMGREGWLYDTELPCMAVVAVRESAPESALAFNERLHRAFYAEGVDITDPGAYRALAEGLVPDVDAFLEALAAPETKKLAWQDFAWAHKSGISGFPTLLLRDGEDWAVVCRGYAPLEALEAPLQEWLAGRLGAEIAEGLYCDPAEGCAVPAAHT